MNSKIIYSPEYDLMSTGVSFFHPFDGKKYSRAWSELQKSCDVDLKSIWLQPEKPISDNALLAVHTSKYLQSLEKSSVISSIIEIPFAKFIPNKLLQNQLIKPMKFACEGTRLATRYALEGAMVMNMGGGFHHAYSTHGGGFCVFADAAIAIKEARRSNLLAANDKVVMIDLDAHRGNGFESIFSNDDSIELFDMYNFQVYPGMHEGELDDYPFMIPLKNKTNDDAYLSILKQELPKFMAANDKPKLAFYNAGTDILVGDPLGNLSVSYNGVIERDRYVIEILLNMNIPTVIVTSGGYSQASYKLIASLASMIIK
jgi:histone deacetylase 11